MPLVDIAFLLWILNCMLISVLAHFVGWATAGTVVVAGWCAILLLATIGETFARGKEAKRVGLRARVTGLKTDLGHMCVALIAILFFPLAYAAVRLQAKLLPGASHEQ
ncbi:hypothetical protein OIU34_23155 [Pararhizobium sp. BT-229]|uniref:hypothetical protein n=1 Tax=Pararhizobium sp. BT-229 TaxID=2986923 RepID=UPI0021F7C2F1|nr:hypothetical protein [Pararhizobium sp. BT-229]MCV9964794.1 hypothetical protein [Pararhizobium sp. BT-229]